MKKQRKLSTNRYQADYESKDKGGASRKGVIDWKKAAGEKELQWFKPREGLNKINIIPYEVKSKLHPLVHEGKMEIGDLDYVLDIWFHRRVGPGEQDVLCPKKNYGKTCLICDKVSELYNDGKKEDAKDLKASRRVFFNIQPFVKGEYLPIHVFESSHFKFMKELIEEAHDHTDSGGIIPFADIQDGKIIKFRMALEKFGKNNVQSYKSFDFVDRDEELSDDIVDSAISFDAGLSLLSAEDIEKIFYGQDEDEDTDKPAKKSRETDDDEPPAKKRAEPEEDDDEEDEPPVKKKSRPADDGDEPPAKKKPAPAEDDDDEPPAKKPAPEKTSGGKCPNGFKWGEADDHKECKKCALWDQCVDA